MLKEKIIKKLNSRRGTSIFFGLLLFLAASILSVVIINGAVTTVKRVTSDKKAEQNYLTCSSAARILQDAIINSKVIRTVTETRTTGTSETSTKTETTWKVAAATDTGTLSPFGDMLKGYVQEYVENTEKFPVSTFGEKELSISVPSNITTEQGKCIGEVTAKLMIDSGAESSGPSEPGCYITVKLKVGTGTDICQMVLTLNGVVSTNLKTTGSETSGKTEKISTTTYTWQANDIFYGEEQRKLKES